MKKNYLLLIFLVPFVVGCSSTKSIQNSSLSPLAQLIHDYEQFDKQLDKDFPSLWPNVSEEKINQELTGLEKLYQRSTNLTVTELNTADNINLEVLALVLKSRIQQLQSESYLFPLNSEGGFLAGIVYSTQNQRVTSDEMYQRFKERLTTLPDYLTTRMEQMRAGQQKGKSSPKVVVQNCINLIADLLATPKNQLFFLNAVRGNEQQTTEISNLLEQEILPAYRTFTSFLQNEYLVKAPEKVGISGITNGKAYYEDRVKYFTTFDITPKEVFDIGQAEVKRIRAEMQQIIDDLGFEGSFANFLTFLRTDPQFYPKTPKELLQQAAWITKEMEGELPKYFGKLPRMPLTVKPVPAALAPNYTGGRYSPGSYENNRAGQYWVNTYKLESRPFYVLPALSLHEGVPGHHLQGMLAAEMENMPNFRQRTYLSAFGEGWGLYSEFLGKEVGMYKTPYEDFGRLTYEMWRACRLVVDPGMHYMDWTRQQAVDFMASNTALSLHEVNTEIDRYIGWPAQAVSYKIGELKIRELRKKVEKELGDDFDIRTFHDLVLGNGSIPLSTLERIVDGFILQNKSPINQGNTK